MFLNADFDRPPGWLGFPFVPGPSSVFVFSFIEKNAKKIKGACVQACKKKDFRPSIPDRLGPRYILVLRWAGGRSLSIRSTYHGSTSIFLKPLTTGFCALVAIVMAMSTQSRPAPATMSGKAGASQISTLNLTGSKEAGWSVPMVGTHKAFVEPLPSSDKLGPAGIKTSVARAQETSKDKDKIAMTKSFTLLGQGCRVRGEQPGNTWAWDTDGLYTSIAKRPLTSYERGTTAYLKQREERPQTGYKHMNSMEDLEAAINNRHRGNYPPHSPQLGRQSRLAPQKKRVASR